jgi:hypothetical protein
MENVTVTMNDLFTGKQVERTIDITNVMIAGSECQEIAPRHIQERLLNEWIEDRANEQHDTILELVSWEVH